MALKFHTYASPIAHENGMSENSIMFSRTVKRRKLSYDTGYRNLTHLVYVLCNIELNVDLMLKFN